MEPEDHYRLVLWSEQHQERIGSMNWDETEAALKDLSFLLDTIDKSNPAYADMARHFRACINAISTRRYRLAAIPHEVAKRLEGRS
jgi:hypothetical protein